MYWKTTDLKDDFVQSTDDFYISRIKFLEDAESKDHINKKDDCWNADAVQHSMKCGKAYSTIE